MAKGKIAQKQPAVLELDPGTYHWCQCGESSNQPFCDGSHAGTDADDGGNHGEKNRRTLSVRRKNRRKCKQTNNAPMCDGSHSSL